MVVYNCDSSKTKEPALKSERVRAAVYDSSDAEGFRSGLERSSQSRPFAPRDRSRCSAQRRRGQERS